jgi:hypothetical protein
MTADNRFVWLKPSPERDALAAWLRENPDATLNQAAREFGVSDTQAHRIAIAYGVRPLKKRRKPGVVATGMLGDLLRQLDGRMSVEELAHRSGVDASMLSRLRGGGVGTHVSLFTMQCLAEVAGYELKLVPKAVSGVSVLTSNVARHERKVTASG